MNSEDFTRFLELLSSTGGGEDGVGCYLRLYRKLEGLFTLKGVCDPLGAAAETIDRAVKKIAEGAPVPDVVKYCMGIARNVAKEILRAQRRESKAFLKFVEELDSGSGEQVARIEQILKPCFELLDAEDRELLVAYCRALRGRARSEYRRELAASMNTTVLALRMRVTRLRKVLSDCVEKRAGDG
jgi:predicted transcriptional regulator of viral defense system